MKKSNNTTFDPASVPPYPVLTLTGVDDPENVTLEGEKFTGWDAYDQALAACIERAYQLGGSVRVRGLDKDGREWPLVITQSGEIHELPTVSKKRRKKVAKKVNSNEQSRRTFIAATIVGFGSLTLLGGGISAGIAIHNSNQPEQVPPLEYPGKGALLPVIPPAGAADVAQWAVKIDQSFTPRFIDATRIAFITPSKALIVSDSYTGEVLWSTTGFNRLDDNGTLFPLTIDSVPMLGFVNRRGLTVWPMDSVAANSSQELTVKTSSAEVYADSEMPLWSLGTQSSQFLSNNALVSIDVPVPARVAGVFSGNAVAVQNGAWLSINPFNQPKKHHLQGTAGGELVDARLVGDTLLSAWQNEYSYTVKAHRLPTGFLLDQVEVKGVLNMKINAPLVSHSKNTCVWAGILMYEGALTSLSTYKPEDESQDSIFKPVLVTDDLVYGIYSNSPARLELETRSLALEDKHAELPTLVSEDGTLVYIVANKLGSLILHALPVDRDEKESINRGDS